MEGFILPIHKLNLLQLNKQWDVSFLIYRSLLMSILYIDNFTHEENSLRFSMHLRTQQKNSQKEEYTVNEDFMG